MSILFECKDLRKNYGKNQALKGLNLQIESGQIVGLLGPNGSGKTTLIKLANGLLTKNGGELYIDGKEVGVETKKIVSYLPERTYLDVHSKVKDVIEFFKDFYSDFEENRAYDMLSKLNINPNDKLKTMSKGTREKVQLILVMSRQAKLYFLDEPIGGVDPELPFDIKFIELTENLQTIQMEEYRIKAFKVNHKVTCYGYSIEIDRSGKFNPEKAKKLGIPLQKWGVLQKGESVEINGGKYTPDMVMGEPRKGLKVTYSTDTRPVPNIVQAATGADLFICEGMYGEPDKEAKAKEYKHMTFKEAAEIAREANPKEMWLTHYSPSLVKPALYMGTVTEIFENAKPGKDGMSVDLIFEEE